MTPLLKPVLIYLGKKDFYLTLARYILALWMLRYAVTKILRTQFVVLPFSLWQQPLELLSGKNIAWAFLGYSAWFQILLGVLELVPSILLLFRRTTLLGSILMLPMTLAVFLINHALDLWATTKQIALILLVLNFMIFVLEWRKVKEIFLIIIQKGKKLKFSVVEIIINSVLLIVVLYFSTIELLDYMNQQNELTGDWYNGHPYEWILETEKLNDSTLNGRPLKIYFGAYGSYSEIDDRFISDGTIKYRLDENKHLIEFYNYSDQSTQNFRYAIQEGTLQLDKLADTTNQTKLTRIFRRRRIHASHD